MHAMTRILRRGDHDANTTMWSVFVHLSLLPFPWAEIVQFQLGGMRHAMCLLGLSFDIIMAHQGIFYEKVAEKED